MALRCQRATCPPSSIAGQTVSRAVETVCCGSYLATHAYYSNVASACASRPSMETHYRTGAPRLSRLSSFHAPLFSACGHDVSQWTGAAYSWRLNGQGSSGINQPPAPSRQKNCHLASRSRGRQSSSTSARARGRAVAVAGDYSGTHNSRRQGGSPRGGSLARPYAGHQHTVRIPTPLGGIRGVLLRTEHHRLTCCANYSSVLHRHDLLPRHSSRRLPPSLRCGNWCAA